MTCVGDFALWSQLASREIDHHQGTADWPGPLPAQVPPVAAWERLGRPYLLQLAVDGTRLGRLWLTPDRRPGADWVLLPASPLTEIPGPEQSALLLPEPLLAELEQAGSGTSLLVVAGAGLRGIALPMLSLPDRPDEWLNAYAAVSVLPSLSWGVHLLDRAAGHAPRHPAWSGYVNPDVGFAAVKVLFGRRSRRLHPGLPELRDALAALVPAVAVVCSHATFTGDGSVDLRDHLGNVVTPDALATWRLPEVAVLVGCRTGTCNPTAPLHLAEAALVAGANHVIVATERTSDELADEVARLALWLMQRTGRPPAWALQSALQRYLRMHPHPEARPLGALMHVGLPACAQTPQSNQRLAARPTSSAAAWLGIPARRLGRQRVR